MSVLRQDPTTGAWVIVAPHRAARPREAAEPAAPEERAACALCPGHEAETPPELLRLPPDPAAPWVVRVVPNKFAVLSPSAERAPEPQGGLLREIAGVGHHEVVVETPDHAGRMARSSADEIARVLDAYHARYVALRRDRRVAYVLAFKNSGIKAGASLLHPHSQIVATPIAPLGLERRYARARAHYDATHCSLYGDLIDRELEEGRRLVYEDARFVVFCPFASGVPFEIWIAPRTPEPSFGATSSAERAALGGVLRATLGALDRALGEPDFNYVLHTAPTADEDKPYYLWHVQILPRITTLAGFELGSGMSINTTFPEDAAATLRGAWEA
jgi:UDPglucose--hexose-1-phosphate uridylyltransferase